MFRGGFGGFGGPAAEEEKEAKDVDNNTLYELLQMPKTATCQEIRRAFRRKALKEHPDKGGDPEKFKKISEANEILSNPEKRDLYDKYGMEGVQAGGNPNGMGGFGDIFSFFGGGGGRRDTGPKKGKPKLIEVQITLEQAFAGCMKTLKHKRTRLCEKCDGKGGANVKQCGKCKGRRVVEKLVQLGPGMYSQSMQPCTECKGKGELMDEKDKCKECQGKKVFEKEKVLEVSIEPGCPDEHDYIFTGQSDEMPGVIAGDVYARVKIKNHKIFERRGADLWLKKKISLFEALTGVNFQIMHLDGKKFQIAGAAGEIISHKERKTVKGKGMPFHKDAMSHGDLHIEFEVEFPKKNVMNPQKCKILKEIFVNQKKPEVENGGKKKNVQNHYLQDFNEKDINKNPRGTNYTQDEDDEPTNGRSAQCRPQ